VVSVTPRPPCTAGKDPVPIVQEAVWAPGPVWTGVENLAPTGIRSPDRPARSQSLYRLNYPAHLYERSKRKIRVFMVTLSSLVIEIRRFESTYILHLQESRTPSFLKMKAIRFSETSETRKSYKQCNIPEDLNPKHQYCEKPKTRMFEIFCGWVFLDNAATVISHRYFDHYYRTHTHTTLTHTHTHHIHTHTPHSHTHTHTPHSNTHTHHSHKHTHAHTHHSHTHTHHTTLTHTHTTHTHTHTHTPIEST